MSFPSRLPLLDSPARRFGAATKGGTIARIVSETTPSDTAEHELARQLATLVRAQVQPDEAGAEVQAVAWWNGLARLGMDVPLMVVHDLGCLLTRPRERAKLASAPDAPDGPLTAYRRLLQEVARTESLAALERTILRDEIVVVLLARLLVDAHRLWRGTGRVNRVRVLLPLSSPVLAGKREDLAQRWDPGWTTSFVECLLQGKVGLLVRLEQLNLAPLRLLGYFAPGGRVLDLASLHQLFSVVRGKSAMDFCLDLLPSLLETPRQSSAQEFAVGGYTSVERRGPWSAIVASELAHDSDVFMVKALSDELLFYGHERPRDERRQVHGILIDGSASMRGAREIFARGLALALAKKLSLMGRSVWLRFFDSRMHRRVPAAALGGSDLPYLLCFRSEHGRHYARAFGDLALELLAAQGEELSLTFITHGQCQIPRTTVARLASMASLFGVFVLPGQELALDYLPLLRGHWPVDAAALARPVDSRRTALGLVQAMTGQGEWR